MAKIGYIGLGSMGGSMAANLQKHLASKGESLTVYNRTASRADPIVALGARLAESAVRVVSDCDITFACLANDTTLLELAEAVSAAAPFAGASDKILCDMSTVHPDTERRAAQQLQGSGVQLVAAPVFGAPVVAAAAKLIICPSGDSAAIARVKPYFDGVMGRATIDLSGRDIGAGPLLKLIGNTLISSLTNASGEALALADATGLGREPLGRFVELMFPGTPHDIYVKRMMLPHAQGYAPEPPARPAFAIDLAIKDVTHALNLAEASGAKLDGLRVVLDHLRQAQEINGPNSDMSAIYGVARTQAGLPFKHE